MPSNFVPSGYRHPRSSSLMHRPQRFYKLLNAFWKSYSMRALSTAWDSAVSPQLCQNGGLLVLSSIGETGKVGWVGDNSRVVFGKKNPWWKQKCEAVRCRYATARSIVAKIQGEVFTNFPAVSVKRHSNMQNWPFALPGRILVKNPPDVKKLWACSSLCLWPVSLFPVSVASGFSIGSLCFLPWISSATAHCQPLHITNRCSVERKSWSVSMVKRKKLWGHGLF
jgi:hypothetical protein